MNKIKDQKTGKMIDVFFRNAMNYDHGQIETDLEIPSGEDMTVPDLSYSVKEILQKFTRGVDPYISKVPQFTDIQDYEGVDPLLDPDFDLTDFDRLGANSNILNPLSDQISQDSINPLNSPPSSLKTHKGERETELTEQRGESEAKAESEVAE